MEKEGKIWNEDNLTMSLFCTELVFNILHTKIV